MADTLILGLVSTRIVDISLCCSHVFASLDVLFADHGVNHRYAIIKGVWCSIVPSVAVIGRLIVTVLTVVACAEIRAGDARLEALAIVLLTPSLATVAALEVLLCARVAVGHTAMLRFNHLVLLTVACIRGNN